MLLHSSCSQISGLDKQNNFFGEIWCAGRSLADELLRTGLAKLVDWNAPREMLEAMKELEATAKSSKLRVWSIAANLSKKEAGATNSTFLRGKVRRC